MVHVQELAVSLPPTAIVVCQVLEAVYATLVKQEGLPVTSAQAVVVLLEFRHGVVALTAVVHLHLFRRGRRRVFVITVRKLGQVARRRVLVV